MSKFFEQVLDLSELFRPDVFFNSLRQHSAREAKVSMDNLKLVCSFSGPMRGVSLNVKITGFQLEGCGFDGTKLTECQEDSPSVITLQPCYVGWIQKVNFDQIFLQFFINIIFCNFRRLRCHTMKNELFLYQCILTTREKNW